MNNNLISKWAGRLSGHPCFVVGNSPSLNKININSIRNFFTIGINRAFFKFDPTILFWQDKELWMTEKNKLLMSKSIRVCHPKGDPLKRFNHFDIKGSGFKRAESPSILHGRGSSGPLAVQFAYALGCNPIFMIGMDCKTDGINTDFFGINKTWKPHTISLCQHGLNWILSEYSTEEVINVSGSASEIDVIADKFRMHAKGIDFYKKLLLGQN
jgi:hypothetical protein